MKILIVGYGSIGRRHFQNLLALGEREISFFRTGQSTLDDQELDGFPIYHDLEEALDQDPDGVVVANPTAFHLDAAIPAARRGCHILLEKPISHTREGVDELTRLVSQHGSRVLVGFQFRYHPNLIQIKGLLEQGLIGEPLAVRSHWGEYLPGWHPWEDYRQGYSARKALGGGVLLTLCHPFDYLGWLFGDAAVAGALLGCRGGLGIDVEDTAEVLLQFDSQVIGSVHLNYLQIPARHTMEILGQKGRISWDYYQNRVYLMQRNAAGKSIGQAFYCPEGFDRNDLFLEEMRHFLAVIAGREEPACTLEDGVRALDLVVEMVQK